LAKQNKPVLAGLSAGLTKRVEVDGDTLAAGPSIVVADALIDAGATGAKSATWTTTNSQPSGGQASVF
jgi:hypothetical protein